VKSLLENLKPRPCRIDRAIARSILQSQDFPVKTKRSRFIISLPYGFFLWFCKPVINPWALRENNSLELAKQSMRCTGHKHKSYNNRGRIDSALVPGTKVPGSSPEHSGGNPVID